MWLCTLASLTAAGQPDGCNNARLCSDGGDELGVVCWPKLIDFVSLREFRGRQEAIDGMTCMALPAFDYKRTLPTSDARSLEFDFSKDEADCCALNSCHGYVVCGCTRCLAHSHAPCVRVLLLPMFHNLRSLSVQARISVASAAP